MIHKKPKDRPISEPHRRANRAGSALRSAIEHVFAEQKTRIKLFVHTIERQQALDSSLQETPAQAGGGGLARATVMIGMANIAYNMRRPVWLEQQIVAT